MSGCPTVTGSGESDFTIDRSAAAPGQRGGRRFLHEDVVEAVRVGGMEVVGLRAEGHPRAVCGDRGVKACEVALLAGCRDRDQGEIPGEQVLQVDVL